MKEISRNSKMSKKDKEKIIKNRKILNNIKV
jgi:hypothetical protein